MKIKGLISKTKLAKLLADNGLPSKMVFETYGNVTRAYITCANREERKKVEDFLEYDCDYQSNWDTASSSKKVNRDFMRESAEADVRVSFFKARGWNA